MDNLAVSVFLQITKRQHPLRQAYFVGANQSNTIRRLYDIVEQSIKSSPSVSAEIGENPWVLLHNGRLLSRASTQSVGSLTTSTSPTSLTLHLAIIPPPQPPADGYDFVIIGAGASGCVVAYNLVQAGYRVALIDAGGNYNQNYRVRIPFEFGSLWGDVGYAPPYEPPWNEWVFPSYSGSEPFEYDYVRASCLGGCANHHAMVAFRGKPFVYDQWAEITSDPSWEYKNIKKYFEKIERIIPHGGGKGWLPISHTEPEYFDLRMMQVITDRFRIPYAPTTIEDQEGIGFWNFMIGENGERTSSSVSLLARILFHPRLDFFPDSLTTRVIFHDKTAVGVEIAKGRTLYKANTEYHEPETPIVYSNVYAKKEVILCGGAINSPQILLLSGVGDASDLNDLDIPVVHDLPEVGKNLMDHPEVWNNYLLHNITHRWQVYFPLTFDNPVFQQYNEYNVGPYKVPFSSIGMNTETPSGYKLHIGFYTIPSNNFNTSQWISDYDFKGKTYASFIIENSEPTSKGYLRLKTASPFDVPYINEELNTDENATALTEGILKMREIMFSISEWSPEEVYPSKPDGGLLTPEQLKEFIKQYSSYGHHICGTCSMSKVVDSNGCVLGVQNLRIIDCSIFPVIPTANPCLVAYMVAEKLSDAILARYPR